jgi:hypothetical protein
MTNTDPQKPSTWKAYQKGMCEGCSAGCCTLPLEVSAYDLMRLELITEDEAASSLKKAAKRLMKEGIVRSYLAKSGVFMIEQRYGRDCIFLVPFTKSVPKCAGSFRKSVPNQDFARNEK